MVNKVVLVLVLACFSLAFARGLASDTCSSCTSQDCLSFQQLQAQHGKAYVCQKRAGGGYKIVHGNVDTVEDSVPLRSVVDVREVKSFRKARLNCLCQPEASQRLVRSAHEARDITVSSSVSWQGTMHVTESIMIAAGVTVTILPGTVLLFANSSASITVSGQIIAIGTASNPIQFLKDPSFTPAAGSYAWLGITHLSASVISLYQNCIFQYASTAITVGPAGTNVSYSTFQYNHVGASTENAYTGIMDIRNSLFDSNVGDGIQISIHSYCQLIGNTITNNGGNGIYYSVVFIQNIAQNLVSNCTIANNMGWGIYSDISYMNVLYTTITNNTLGGIENAWYYMVLTYCNIYGNGGVPIAVEAWGLFNTFNWSLNYWGTTNATWLAQVIDNYFQDPNQAIVILSPAFSEPYPCSNCLVDVSVPLPPNYMSHNFTWTLAGSPYYFTSNVVIMPGAWVTVEPGVVVKFSANAGLYIDGGISAIGTASNYITFTSANSSGTWAYFGLRGNRFSSAPTLVMSYCVVEKLSTYFQVTLWAGLTIIDHSVFRLNQYGLYITSDSPLLVSNSVISQNQAGIYCDADLLVTLESCTISDNMQGISVNFGPSSMAMYNCTITRNTAYAFVVTSAGEWGTYNLYYNHIYQNRPGAFNIPFWYQSEIFNLTYNDIYDNSQRPNSPFYFGEMESTGVTTPINVSLNYWGDVSGDSCFFSGALGSANLGYNNTATFVYNPILTSPIETDCTIQNITIANAMCSSSSEVTNTGLDYDACGVCGGDNSTCTTGTCSDNPYAPYTCSGYNILAPLKCVDVPIVCLGSELSCQSYNYQTCWNGACVTTYSQCPVFPRCSFQRPVRCPDGACIGATEQCPTPYRCPLTLCPDGSCASNCVPFNGCNTTVPYLCMDGSCAKNGASCQRGSCTSGNSFCADGTCKASCPTPAWFTYPIASYFYTWYGNSGPLQSSTPGQTVTFIFPVGSPVTYVTISPVPDSTLRATSQPWTNPTGFEHNVLSMVVNLTSAITAWTNPITITFNGLTLSTGGYFDCLGTVDFATNAWRCVSSLTQSGSSYSGNITQLGIYAIIRNPVPPTLPPTIPPTVPPTQPPSQAPTPPPSAAPTIVATSSPTDLPTVPATVTPTQVPTRAPTSPPSVAPTEAPTTAPTKAPTVMPTASPTQSPSPVPSPVPTGAPSDAPTSAPTSGPLMCGDGVCTSGNENCQSCPADCGVCPMVILDRNDNYVLTASSFKSGASLMLAPWDNTTMPAATQAWNWDPVTGFITNRAHPNWILGGGPASQNIPSNKKSVGWNIKAAVLDINTAATHKLVNQFDMVTVTDAPEWSYLVNRQLNGGGKFWLASCLYAPNAAPQVPGALEAWITPCKAGTWKQEFKFVTYVDL